MIAHTLPHPPRGLALRGPGLVGPELALAALADWLFWLRMPGLSLPLFCAAMVYALWASLLPGTRPARLAAAAFATAVLVELFRLVHAPWLDAFRLTTAGALLIGRVFSPWDPPAYAAGVALAAAVHAAVHRQSRRGSPSPAPAAKGECGAEAGS